MTVLRRAESFLVRSIYARLWCRGELAQALAVGESQQGKLAGCLHAFTVCTPSKESSGRPHTPKLMIKHQGQHNVAAGDGVYDRGGVDGGRGVSGYQEEILLRQYLKRGVG